MKTTKQLTYKDVCGTENTVWFELDWKNIQQSSKQFLTWAKSLGCTWRDGSEIQPEYGTDAVHLSVRADGHIAFVSMMIWTHPATRSVKRYSFERYIKGDKTPICNNWRKIG